MKQNFDQNTTRLIVGIVMVCMNVLMHQKFGFAFGIGIEMGLTMQELLQ